MVHPPGLLDRHSGEHWAGRLYMRSLSSRVTRQLTGTRVVPNHLTLLMIVVGWIAAAIVSVPGLLTALLTAVLIQVYLLLDCIDGEVARWQKRTSAAGVYLDRLGHHVVEAALAIGVTVRAGGGPGADDPWPWIALGGVTALLIVVGKLESDLVIVARATAGLGAKPDAASPSGISSVRRFRSLLSRLPLHRLVGAVELSLAVVVAAVVDTVVGAPTGTRVLAFLVAGVALVVAVGHPVTVLTSDRLK